MLAAFKAGELERDFVAVVRCQGPRANGMPELHKLTPPLGGAAGQGLSRRARHRRPHERRVGQGAGGDPRQPRGRSPAAPLGQGARRRPDPARRAWPARSQALVPDAEWAAREPATLPPTQAEANGHGLGRELFAGMRRNVVYGRRRSLHMAVGDTAGARSARR